LHNGANSATDSEGLAGPLKGALFGVVDTLLDQVLRNLGCGLLGTFGTAGYCRASDAVGNTAYFSATQYAH
jgi:hypothetical protein